MKTINQHIKNNTFVRVYILYGKEEYLKNQFKNRLLNALLPDSRDMNLTVFSDEQVELETIVSETEMFPFMADHRVVLLDDVDIIAKDDKAVLAAFNNIPDTAVIILLSKKYTKASVMVKGANDNIYAACFDNVTESERQKYILSKLSKENIKITEDNMSRLLSVTGDDFYNINNETEKLISYLGDRDVVTEKDIITICSPRIEDKIFDAIDAIAKKDYKTAYKLYLDLKLLETPMAKIFANIIRQFRILLVTKEMLENGHNNQQIADATGVKPYFVSKYISQSNKFSKKALKSYYDYALTLLFDQRIGNLKEELMYELFFMKEF
ncbi:MAG: DNA polymerase III subunit delta [Lachnospiraceae bacterium]|nr:DNA polymerase III subunit delta [Lachnospiraceae bacterium]